MKIISDRLSFNETILLEKRRNKLSDFDVIEVYIILIFIIYSYRGGGGGGGGGGERVYLVFNLLSMVSWGKEPNLSIHYSQI